MADHRRKALLAILPGKREDLGTLTSHEDPIIGASWQTEISGMYPYAELRYERRTQNSNTVVAAPLGIEPNTIKYQPGTTTTTNRRLPRTVSQDLRLMALPKNEGRTQNSSTIVPPPLGIEPNTIKCQPRTNTCLRSRGSKLTRYWSSHCGVRH